jgi:hypothetical protein
MIDALGKYLFYKFPWTDSYYKDERIKNRLCRLNRETPAYYYSDVQRAVKDWNIKPLEYEWNKDISLRFKKKKYFDENGEVKKRENHDFIGFVNKNAYAPMISDMKFDELFHIEKFNPNIMEAFIARKNSKKTTFAVYDLDDKKIDKYSFMGMTYFFEVGKHLEELFGKKAYFVDRMKCVDERGEERLSYGCYYRKNDDYDRNCIFYQCTVHGDDKDVISGEENRGNESVYFWMFEDKIAFTGTNGCDLW